jgi:hypothetical protein
MIRGTPECSDDKFNMSDKHGFKRGNGGGSMTCCGINTSLKPIAKLQEAAISAISFVGKPYVFGGSNPDVGFDCSGLVQYVLLQSGVKKLPAFFLRNV